MYLLLLLSSKYCQMLKRLKRIISLRTRCARGFCSCRFPAGARAGINTAREFWGAGGSGQSPAGTLSQPCSPSGAAPLGFGWDGGGKAGKTQRWPSGTRGSAGERLWPMISEAFPTRTPQGPAGPWVLHRGSPGQLFQPLWQERFSPAPGRILGEDQGPQQELAQVAPVGLRDTKAASGGAVTEMKPLKGPRGPSQAKPCRGSTARRAVPVLPSCSEVPPQFSLSAPGQRCPCHLPLPAKLWRLLHTPLTSSPGWEFIPGPSQ